MQPLSESAVRTSAAHGVSSDQRVRKLLAYAQAPFEKTVFFDGDTHVRDVQVSPRVSESVSRRVGESVSR